MTLDEFQTLLEDATFHRISMSMHEVLCPHCWGVQTRQKVVNNHVECTQVYEWGPDITSDTIHCDPKHFQTELSFLMFQRCSRCGTPLIYIELERVSRPVVTDDGCFYDQGFEHATSELELLSCANDTQLKFWTVAIFHNVRFEGDTDRTPVDLEFHTVGPFVTGLPNITDTDTLYQRTQKYFDVAAHIVELLIEMLDHCGTLPKNVAEI